MSERVWEEAFGKKTLGRSTGVRKEAEPRVKQRNRERNRESKRRAWAKSSRHGMHPYPPLPAIDGGGENPEEGPQLVRGDHCQAASNGMRVMLQQ